MLNSIESQAETWLMGDIGSGYIHQSSTLAGRLDLNGVLLKMQAGVELRDLGYGDLQFALGFQEAWQSGSSSTRQQDLNVGSVQLSAGYLHSVFNRNFLLGAKVEGWFGAGAHLDVLAGDGFQSTWMIGPQAAYRYRLNDQWELNASIAALFDFNLPERSVFTLPVLLGLRMNLAPPPADPTSARPSDQ